MARIKGALMNRKKKEYSEARQGLLRRKEQEI